MDSKTPKQLPGLNKPIKKEPIVNDTPNIDMKALLKKSNPGPTNSARLPSFRGPRDLTLSSLATTSGVGASQLARPKKTFVPNIPTRREKGEKIIESKSDKAIKREPKSPKKERGRGKGRNKEKEFIQTRGSLFGEGLAASSLRKSSGGGYGGGRASSTTKPGEIQRPVLNTKAVYNIDKDAEAQRLKELLRDDFIDDDPDDDDESEVPVQLPMWGEKSGGRSRVFSKKARRFLQEQKEKKEKSDVIVEVKQEPGTKTRKPERMSGAPPKECTNEEPSLADIFTKSQPAPMFFQLPLPLPGHPPDVVQEVSAGAAALEIATPTPTCCLESLPAGRIGTLRVFESGRVCLCLGEHVFDLSKGIEIGFLQDVVRIELESEKNKGEGSMTVLGHIGERIVVTPDFNQLVKEKNL